MAMSDDVQCLFSSDGRGFLVRNNGDQVKIDDLKGKVVGYYFSASWCPPCKKFTPKLIQLYNELASKNDFEVVFVSSDRDEQSFNDYFSKMPWLAIPLADKELIGSLKKLFNVKGIPCLALLDGNSKVVMDNAVGFVEDYGAKLYPFSEERIQYFKDLEEKARKEQTLSSILVSGSRDYLITNDRNRVPVAKLEGKIVALNFCSSSYGPCAEFNKQLSEVYSKLNGIGEDFKVVLITLDGDEQVFNESIKDMPWLALPFQDNSKLIRYFGLSTLPTLVVIGADGKTLHPNAAELVKECGVEAYPFSSEKVSELEERKKAEGNGETEITCEGGVCKRS